MFRFFSPLDYDFEGYGSEFADFGDLNPIAQPPLNDVRLDELRREQRADQDVGLWINYLESNTLTGNNAVDCATVTMSRYLGIENDVLYFFWELIGDKEESSSSASCCSNFFLRSDYDLGSFVIL